MIVWMAFIKTEVGVKMWTNVPKIPSMNVIRGRLAITILVATTALASQATMAMVSDVQM